MHYKKEMKLFSVKIINNIYIYFIIKKVFLFTYLDIIKITSCASFATVKKNKASEGPNAI